MFLLSSQGNIRQKCLGVRICAVKREPRRKNAEKNLSLLEWRYFLVNVIAVLKETKKSKKKSLSLLAGKLFLEKKAALLNGVWFWVKNILSLLAGKITEQQISLIKSQSICLISSWTLFKSADFFFLFDNPT